MGPDRGGRARRPAPRAAESRERRGVGLQRRRDVLRGLDLSREVLHGTLSPPTPSPRRRPWNCVCSMLDGVASGVAPTRSSNRVLGAGVLSWPRVEGEENDKGFTSCASYTSRLSTTARPLLFLSTLSDEGANRILVVEGRLSFPFIEQKHLPVHLALLQPTIALLLPVAVGVGLAASRTCP